MDTRLAYEEALRLVPELVEKETNFRYFLAAEDGNVTKAALRICKYWTTRRLIFGESRWKLPMNQTGRGCLSTEDIEIFRSGFLVMVPRGNKGPVLFCDRSKLPRTAGMCGTRLSFYLASVFPDDCIHPDGITLMYIVTSAPFPEVYLEREQMTYCLESLPARFRRYCIAQSYELGKERLIDSLGHHQRRVFEYQTGFSPDHVAEDSVQSTVRRLERLGLERSDSIPIRLGGDLDETRHFAEWIRQRLSVEDVMSAAPLMLNTVFTGGVARPNHKLGWAPSQSATALAPYLVPQPPPPRRKRTYEKYNELITEMRYQVEALRTQNSRLRLNKRSLEEALARARLMAAMHTKTP